MWSGTKIFHLAVGSTLAVPLTHAYSLISVKPIANQIYTFSNQIAWESVTKPSECVYELRACHSNRGDTYRLICLCLYQRQQAFSFFCVFFYLQILRRNKTRQLSA